MEVARIWRNRKQRYSLEGITCNHCGAHQFPARPVCQQCGKVIGTAALTSEIEVDIPVVIRIPERAELSWISRG